MDDLTPLQQINDEVNSSNVYLFEPRAAYRMEYQGTMREAGTRSYDPEYIDPGAILDYYLANAASSDVILEILDASGTVIRGFSCASDGYTYPDQEEMRAPYLARLGQPRLETGAGHHRFIWDLSHPGATAPASATGLYGRP